MQKLTLRSLPYFFSPVENINMAKLLNKAIYYEIFVSSQERHLVLSKILLY